MSNNRTEERLIEPNNVSINPCLHGKNGMWINLNLPDFSLGRTIIFTTVLFRLGDKLRHRILNSFLYRIKYCDWRVSKISASIVLFMFILLFTCQIAQAYIDPGTGSYMLQIAIAFLVGALFTVKGFWKKIFTFLNTLFAKKKKNGDRAL